MSNLHSSLFDVAGKTVLVTGGSSGIGEMIATTFARQGARVIIAARKPDRLAAAVERIGRIGDVRGIPADLSAEESIRTFVDELGAATAQLDVLVNNAGATWGAPFAEFPAAAWDRVMNLNVRSIFLLTQALAPLLARSARDEDWSRVINLSSVGAHHTGDDPSIAYGPSKAAVEQLTRVMTRWLARERITANCIAPGWFPSRMNAPLDPGYRDRWLRDTPAGRLGTAEDIGGLAIFLASRAGAFVNGQTIACDGGWSA